MAGLNVTPIPPNTVFTFLRYEVQTDGMSVRLYFQADNPGPENPNEWMIAVTDTELSGVSNLGQMRTLVTTKLNRLIRSTGIAAKLDLLIGQSLTI